MRFLVFLIINPRGGGEAHRVWSEKGKNCSKRQKQNLKKYVISDRNLKKMRSCSLSHPVGVEAYVFPESAFAFILSGADQDSSSIFYF